MTFPTPATVIPVRNRLARAAIILVVLTLFGCRSAQFESGFSLRKPRFSCESLTRWSTETQEKQRFRQQVAADPFPHASQLGVAGGLAQPPVQAYR